MPEGMLGKLPLSEIRGPRDAFEEKLAGKDGPAWLEAFTRFLRKENPWPKKVTFDLGDGWVFTVLEIIELEADFSTSPDEILQRGVHNPADWKYLGKKPESITRKVKAAIGRLNQAWTEEGIAKLLSRPDCPLKGSGAWVREAYIKARPRYDEKGWIGFPDSETSRWRSRVDGGVCFPSLWYVSRDWRRGLTWTGREWFAERRICLLRG